MTKSACRMTNQLLISNDERMHGGLRLSSSFVIWISFVLRHSCLVIPGSSAPRCPSTRLNGIDQAQCWLLRAERFRFPFAPEHVAQSQETLRRCGESGLLPK